MTSLESMIKLSIKMIKQLFFEKPKQIDISCIKENTRIQQPRSGQLYIYFSECLPPKINCMKCVPGDLKKFRAKFVVNIEYGHGIMSHFF